MAPRRSRCRVCRGAGEGAGEGGLRALDERVRELMRDCLQLQLDDDTASESVLCDDCSVKLEAFYDFKQLALESDEYFNTAPSEPEDNVEDLAETCWDDVFDTFENDFYPLEELKLLRDVKFIDRPEKKWDIVRDRSLSLDSLSKELSCNPALTLDTLNKGFDFDPMDDDSDREIKPTDQQSQGVKRRNGRRKASKALKRKRCSYCGQHFLCPKGLRKHILSKHLGLVSFCNICKKSFKDIKSHNLLVHNKEKLPFECDVCNKRFLYQNTLNDHKLTHTDIKPYQCPECKKSFKNKGNLGTHRKTVHESKRPHMCDYCSKTFSAAKGLKRHIQLHTNEKPYGCDTCGKFYTYRESLIVHIKIHMGIKDHKCNKCDKAFGSLGGLYAHQSKHNKTKNFQCNYCDIKFGRKDNMIAHKRRAHKIEESLALGSEKIFGQKSRNAKNCF